MTMQKHSIYLFLLLFGVLMGRVCLDACLFQLYPLMFTWAPIVQQLYPVIPDYNGCPSPLEPHPQDDEESEEDGADQNCMSHASDSKTHSQSLV